MCLEAIVDSGSFYAACLLITEPVFLPCWLFGLRHSSTGVYKHFEWGQVLMPKCQTPEDLMNIPWIYLCHQWPCPYGELLPSSPTPPPWDIFKTSKYLWPRSVRSHNFCPGSQYSLCAPSKSGVSVSPQYCGAPVIKPFWASKPNTLGHLPSNQTPKLGSLTWGLRNLTPVG